jgi:hypothetical protein
LREIHDLAAPSTGPELQLLLFIIALVALLLLHSGQHFIERDRRETSGII